MWQDEIVSARILSEPTPWGMLLHVARTESTPPVWYALGWLVHHMGLDVEVVRALSVLFGTMLAALVVILARRVVPLWAAALAGVIVALGDQLVVHGRELRAYELYALLAVLYALVLIRFGTRPGSGTAVALAIVVIAGSLTHYWFLLVVLASLVWLWASDELREVRARTTKVVALGMLPFALWSPVLAVQYHRQRFAWIGPFDLDVAAAAYWRLFVGRSPHPEVVAYLVWLAALAIVLVGSLILYRRSNEGRLYALLAVGPFAVGALVWLSGPQVFAWRNLIGVGPFAAIAVAAAVARMPRGLGPPTGVAVAALALLGFGLVPSRPPAPYDDVADALVRAGWQRDDAIVAFGDFFDLRGPLAWYLPGRQRLTLAEPTGGSCKRVFFISRRKAVSVRVLGRYPEAAPSHFAAGTVVARIDTPGVLGGATWRGGHLIATPDSAAACLRPLPETSIVARLDDTRL